MAVSLASHDELLRQVIETHDGAVFKHTGDGCCAVFDGPTAGLSAAVAAQVALSAADSGPAATLRVRMALHTGTAQARGDDYFGPTLNRTARLLATAHGGQIVLTRAAEQQARGGLPPKVELVDLGEHRLADLLQPERVFQANYPGLPPAFPPLRSAHRHNLPSLSPFVGRRAEVDEVSGLMASANLITLTGVGGAGKTRLALEVAGHNLDAFPDGAFFVELAPLSDPALVPDRVTTTLGMATEEVKTASDLTERLGQYLQARGVLLVLDNCEHLVAAAAALADDLLSRCPRLVILATSREPLGLAGEMCWPVPPLSLPPADASVPDDLSGADAVALFCARGRAVEPRFSLSPDNVPAVVQICRRLDGIPLALELAAARLRLLSAEQLAERLDDRFRLLTGGSRTALPRHQTLQAALDWSYQLLSDRERILLARLSVFSGSFALDAAETVGADDELVRPADVLDLLGALVDKSLVGVEAAGPERRYRLLETVRQYGAERLAEANESDATVRRHRDFFLGLADAANANRDLWATDTSRWLHRVRMDLDNFRAALDWSSAAGEPESYLRLATALTFYCFLDGRMPEGQAWLEDALHQLPASPTPPRMTALAFLGFLLLFQGEAAGAEAVLQEARTQAASIGDRNGTAMASLYLSVLATSSGDIDGVEATLEGARQDFEDLGLEGPIGWCCVNQGWLAVRTGDHSRADAAFTQGLEIGRRVRSDDLIAHALAALGSIAAVRGDAGRAMALADEAVDVARRMGLRLSLVTALTRAAEAAVVLGRLDQGASRLTESLALLCDAGSLGWGADCLELTALLLVESEPHLAVRCLASASAIREFGGQPMGNTPTTEEVDRCRARLVEGLGREVFAREWAGGMEAPVDQALRVALQALAMSRSAPG
jgi:predicted ATPase